MKCVKIGPAVQAGMHSKDIGLKTTLPFEHCPVSTHEQIYIILEPRFGYYVLRWSSQPSLEMFTWICWRVIVFFEVLFKSKVSQTGRLARVALQTYSMASNEPRLDSVDILIGYDKNIVWSQNVRNLAHLREIISL